METDQCGLAIAGMLIRHLFTPCRLRVSGTVHDTNIIFTGVTFQVSHTVEGMPTTAGRKVPVVSLPLSSDTIDVHAIKGARGSAPSSEMFGQADER
jgi:hypothetical protein